jgi:hypothetical protein
VKTQPLPTAANQTTFTTVDSSVFNAGTSSGIIESNGTVGDPPNYTNPIGGTVNSAGTTPSSASTHNKLTLGSPTDTTGDAGSVFARLIYKVLTNGTAVITPNFLASPTSLVTVVTPGTGATAPSYGSRPVGVGDTVTYLPALTIIDGSAGHSIIALTAASAGTPTLYGTSKGTLTVTGNGGNYTPQFLPVSPAAVTGYVEGKGFSPATDNEIYGLDVTNLGTTAAVLATEINTSYGSTIATTTYPGPGANPLGGAYNIFLDFSTPPSGDNFLGFDFTQDPDALNQGATVASVALVPEPASIGLLMGASGLLLGRR